MISRVSLAARKFKHGTVSHFLTLACRLPMLLHPHEGPGCDPVHPQLSALAYALQVRHMFLATGCIPADRESITAGLRRRSLGFLPEGIAGIFNGANRWADPDLVRGLSARPSAWEQRQKAVCMLLAGNLARWPPIC